jgi:hypothetical protein
MAGKDESETPDGCCSSRAFSEVGDRRGVFSVARKNFEAEEVRWIRRWF